MTTFFELFWFGDCMGFAFKKVKLQVESLSKALSDLVWWLHGFCLQKGKTASWKS